MKAVWRNLFMGASFAHLRMLLPPALATFVGLELPRSLLTSDLALKHVSPGGVREELLYAQIDSRPSAVGGAAGMFTCRVLLSLTSLA